MKIMDDIVAIPIFQDNYVWLIPATNGADATVLIVDPGDAPPVLNYLREHCLQPLAILVTHQCYDHVDGIREVLSHYSIPVYGPATESIPCMTHPLTEGDELLFGQTHLEVIDLPGHTAGHIAYYQAGQTGKPGRLFCGDTLFAAGCGRLHTGLYDAMFQSLQKIAALPDETLNYCAHEYTVANLRFARQVEPDNNDIEERMNRATAMRERDEITIPSTLAEEKKSNPFLRCHAPAVADAAKEYAAHLGTEEPKNPAAVFRLIRHWKNNFRG